MPPCADLTRALTETVSSAATRSPKDVFERSLSQCGARIAKKPWKRPRSTIATWRNVAHQRSSRTDDVRLSCRDVRNGPGHHRGTGGTCHRPRPLPQEEEHTHEGRTHDLDSRT